MTTGSAEERALDAIADASIPVLVRRRRRARFQPDARARGALRPVRRRWRLHRALDGDHRQGARPVPRRRPDRRGRDRSAASGRNGGFMESTLTHGIANGQQRFPDEIELLERLGLENLDEIEAAIERYGIDCDYERTGVIDVATTRRSRATSTSFATTPSNSSRLGQDARWLDADAMRAEVDSPTYVGGLWRNGRAALVDPARLAWGLKAAAERLGVRIYEDTKAAAIERDGGGTVVRRHSPRSRPPAWSSPPMPSSLCCAGSSFYIVPVYDYAMVTEPLSEVADEERGMEESPGLVRLRQPISLLPPHRGQPDPVGRLRRGVLLAGPGGGRAGEPAGDVGHAQPALLHRPSLSSTTCASATSGAGRSTRAAGSACSGGRPKSGRVAYALGYTGLGVAASRFGAGGDARPARRPAAAWRRRPTSSRTSRCRSRPSRSATPASRPPAGRSHREDRTGKRNLWLRTLDRLGLGFDSLDSPDPSVSCGDVPARDARIGRSSTRTGSG